MSWEAKTDYCGLAVANKLLTKSANPNTSASYLEKHGANGDYKFTKVFGQRDAPTNAYTIADSVTITGKALGTVVTVDTKKYALESIKWSTGADQEPSFDAASKEVAGATRNTFAVPEFTISPDQIAQIPSFKFPVSGGGTATSVAAFSLSGTDCELTKCDGEISCKVGTNDKNGLPQAHDVTNGHVVLSLTICQYGQSTPTLTPAAGWDVSSPLNCDDPDSDTPTWTVTLTHPLTKTMAD